MDKIISKGYAELITPESGWAKCDEKWYLPHHGVRHPVKQKLRVVLDCRAKTVGVALNDLLLQGPNMMNSLVGVLSRFRRFKVAFCGDIESMFYQVRVAEEHKTYLRLLWWPGGDFGAEVQEYAMTVHPSGAVSSPSVANYVLQQTRKKYSCNKEVKGKI